MGHLLLADLFLPVVLGYHPFQRYQGFLAPLYLPADPLDHLCQGAQLDQVGQVDLYHLLALENLDFLFFHVFHETPAVYLY